MSTTSLLRLPQVRERVGLSRSTIYARVSNGTFPAPVRIGGNAVAWVDSDVAAWIAAQIEASRLGAPRRKSS
jgi:prophage regulatory protein